jgi:GNAT superfamily N-acetyltransferase
MEITRHDDPVAYEALVTPFLLRDEARYNLLLALAARLAQGETFGDAKPYLLTVHDGDALVGATLRTPPYNPILDAVPVVAAPLVADVMVDDGALPNGALGPPDTVAAYARRDAERTGSTHRVTREQGVYRLTTLVPPRPTTGTFRNATAADADLVLAWDHAFVTEVGLPEREAGRLHQRIADGLVWVWEDRGEVVSLAGCGGYTPNGARIGPVYTPPERRGRGYGSAVTAGATTTLLDAGRTYCFLYTDLANATSNKIYRDIGYEHVTDVREVTFDR